MRKRSPVRRKPVFKYRQDPPSSLAQTLRDIGPCVYFVRLADGVIKIGWTSDFAERRRKFGPIDILAIVPGTLDDERSIHARLIAHRARGREYYRPDPPVLAEAEAALDRLRALAS